MLDGQRFRYCGANAANDIGTVGTANGNHYGGVDHSGSYLTTHTQADAFLNSAARMNLRVIKATWSAHTTNHVDAVEPTLGVYNAAALDPLDYTLSRCAALGMKVIVPLAEQYFVKPWYVSVTGGGGNDQFYLRTATVNAYKAHIAFVLNHVSPYTGLAMKNDPTVLCFEIGNEFILDGVTNAQYATWADDIGHYIKVTLGAQQLVQDGAYGVIPDCLTSPYLDIFDQHAYDRFRTPAFLINEAHTAHTAGKAYFVGEFDWTDWIQGTGAWTLDHMLDAWERSPYIDGGTFWDLLAPLTIWNDGYTLHSPGDDANMRTRGNMLADHALRMKGITPTTFVSDTFTGVDGTVLSSHVGETGATWAFNDGWTDVARIQNNRLYGGSGQGRYYSTGIPASSDYTVTADIYVASNSGYAGVLAHVLTEQNYSYAAHVWNYGGTVMVFLDYTPAGTLATHTIATPVVGSSHTLRLKIQNTGLSAYWDDMTTPVIGPIYNTGLPSAGRAGVILGGGASPTTGYHINSLTATDL